MIVCVCAPAWRCAGYILRLVSQVLNLMRLVCALALMLVNKRARQVDVLTCFAPSGLPCRVPSACLLQRRYGYAVVAMVGLGLYAAATISRVEDVHREGRKPK